MGWDVRERLVGYIDPVMSFSGNGEADKVSEIDMQEHDTNYCEFREIKSVVVTWNAGATTPASLRYDERDNNFFREVIQADDPPDILAFGFQELVDLEDKKLTASP